MGPKAIIGLSVETWEDVERAERLDADYLGVSPVFATPTKTDTKEPWGLEGLARIRAFSRHPLVAIGGLNASNAEAVVMAGADSVAVVSAICASPDPLATSRELDRISSAPPFRSDTGPDERDNKAARFFGSNDGATNCRWLKREGDAATGYASDLRLFGHAQPGGAPLRPAGEPQRALAETGLAALGVTSPEIFWEEIVNPTWVEGSTTQAGYKRVMAERIAALRLAPGAPPRRSQAAASRFVESYLDHSRIDPRWRPLLARLSENPDVGVIIATDHYAEATGRIIDELGAWGIPAVKIGATARL